MKISLKQLDTVLGRMKYSLVGYSNEDKDLEIDISFITADPGSGMMVDTMLIKAEALPKEGEEKEVSMQVELFEPREEQIPRATRTESFKIDKKF